MQNAADKKEAAPDGTGSGAGQMGGMGDFIRGRGVWSLDRATVTGDYAGRKPRGQMLKDAWASVKKAYAPRIARKETFEEAVSRLGLTAEALERQEQSILWSGRLAYAVAALTLLPLIYAAAHGEILRVIATAILIFFCALQGWIRAMRVWQIRTRHLGSAGEFFAAAEKWIV